MNLESAIKMAGMCSLINERKSILESINSKLVNGHELQLSWSLLDDDVRVGVKDQEGEVHWVSGLKGITYDLFSDWLKPRFKLTVYVPGLPGSIGINETNIEEARYVFDKSWSIAELRTPNNDRLKLNGDSQVLVRRLGAYSIMLGREALPRIVDMLLREEEFSCEVEPTLAWKHTPK